MNHKEVEHFCDEFFYHKNFERRNFRKIIMSQNAKPSFHSNMDRIYVNDKNTYICEIKPPCTIGELKKGIGQVILWLEYDALLFLVIFEQDYKKIEKVISYIPDIGIMTYPKYGNIIMVKESIRTIGGKIPLKTAPRNIDYEIAYRGSPCCDIGEFPKFVNVLTFAGSGLYYCSKCKKRIPKEEFEDFMKDCEIVRKTMNQADSNDSILF